MVRLDPERREVIVGPRARLATRWLRLRDVNWLGDDPLSRDGSQVAARIRSTAPLQAATVYAGDARPDGSPDGSQVRVLLHEGEHGVAAGQACVFYADTGPRARVLGGGWIVSASSDYNLGVPDGERTGCSPLRLPDRPQQRQGSIRSGRT